MAGALIPLIISGVSALLPVVPDLVKAAEALFGPKTGDAKLSLVVAMLREAAEKLAAAGKISGVPDQGSLTTLAEAVVQQLKAAGQLSGAGTAGSTPVSGAPTTTTYTGATVIVFGGVK